MGNCFRPGDTLSVHSGRPDVHLGEVALRYFRTFDMFSEHCDDNHELAAMYYFVFPQNKRTVMFFRLGAGLAFCDRECRDDQIGFPVDIELVFRLCRYFSLGLFVTKTYPEFDTSGYGGAGFTASILF